MNAQRAGKIFDRTVLIGTAVLCLGVPTGLGFGLAALSSHGQEVIAQQEAEAQRAEAERTLVPVVFESAPEPPTADTTACRIGNDHGAWSTFKETVQPYADAYVHAHPDLKDRNWWELDAEATSILVDIDCADNLDTHYATEFALGRAMQERWPWEPGPTFEQTDGRDLDVDSPLHCGYSIPGGFHCSVRVP